MRKNKKKKLALTQNAYLAGVRGSEFYTACAVDEDGNTYQVDWKIKSDFDPCVELDEGHACDWDNPAVIRDEYGDCCDVDTFDLVPY